MVTTLCASAPKWVFRHQKEGTAEATRNSGTVFDWDRLDESELKVCKKWAALANIQLPSTGDQFVAKTHLPLYLDDKFLTSAAVLPKDSMTGPITGYSYYEDTRSDMWDPPSGLCIEYDLDMMGETRTVFAKLTRNSEVFAEIYHAAEKNRWRMGQ